jgi:two-component sensor histidine kinase
LAHVSLRGQEFPKLHFTVEDGLCSNTVYSTYRDSRGFMWFTTDKGIVRYNGVRFEVYNTFNGLPDNEVFFLREDYSGRLWLATYNGELCYFKNGKFFTATNKGFLRTPVKTPQVWKINLESDSSVTIIFNDKAFVNIKNETSRYYSPACYTPEERRQVINVTKLGPVTYRLTGASKNCILRFTSAGCSVQKTEINRYHKDSRGIKDVRWEGMGSQGRNYLFNDSYVFDDNWNVLYQFPANFHKNFFLHQLYHSGKDWFIATKRGALLNSSLLLLKDNDVSCVTQDDANNYWISTLNDGVFVLDKSFLSSREYAVVYCGSIKYTKVINELLFFVNENGDVFTLDNITGQVRCAFRYSNFFSGEPRYSYPVFYIDDNYKFYYNSNKNGFTVDNLLAGKLVVRKSFSDLQPFYAFKKTCLQAGNIYINAGFRVVRTTFGNMESKKLVYNIIGDSADDKVYAFCQAPDSSLWYSTLNGVFKINNGEAVLQKQFKKLVFKSFTFLGNRIVGYTHNNKLLVCYNPDNNLIIDTVASQNCVWDKMYVMDSNHLFINTDGWYKVLAINDKAGKGNISINTIDNSFVPLHAEPIAFGGNTGYFFKNGVVTSIAINRLLQESQAPKLYFTNVIASGTVYNPTRSLEVPFEKSKDILIAFTPVSFAGKKITYEYSFAKKGVEKWTDIKEEQLNIANPGFGNYQVKVRAKTLSSDYSDPIVLDLSILRPFWATWWFIGIVVCVIMILIWILIRNRIAVVLTMREKEHNNQVKFMKSEYRALNALMNPHFIFNTLNNVQSLVNNGDKRSANEYLRIFADLIRQNMHNVSSELISLEKEMNLVRNYLLLEKLRFEDNLHYSISTDGIDLSEIMVPPLLIQPLVENSIKHGIYPLESPEGMVEVRVYERNDMLYIESRDNGVGLNWQASNIGDEGHISFGLENVKKRIEQLSIIQNRQILFDIGEVEEDGQRWTVAKVSMSL